VKKKIEKDHLYAEKQNIYLFNSMLYMIEDHTSSIQSGHGKAISYVTPKNDSLTRPSSTS
jgi:hypothetical protein